MENLDLINTINNFTGLSNSPVASIQPTPNMSVAPTNMSLLPASLQNLKNPTTAQTAAISAYNNGYKGTTKSNTFSGGASVGQGQATTKAMAAGLNSIIPPPSSSSNTKITPPVTDGKQPTPVIPPIVTNSDPVLSNLNTQMASLTTQYNNGVSLENSNYEQLVNDANAVYAPQYAQVQKDKANAIKGAEASWDASNPGSSGSDKEEFIASVGSQYDNAIQQMSATHQANMDNLYQTHSGNLLGLSSSYMSAQNSLNANIAAQYQQNFTNLNTMLANAPVTPENVDTYLQTAINAGMTPDEAIAYLTSPSYKSETLNIDEAKLAISQGTLGVAEENAQTNQTRALIAGAAYNLQYKVAGGTTTTTKPNVLQGIGNALTGQENTSTATKTLGNGPISIAGTTYTIGQDIGGGYIANADGSLTGPDGTSYTLDSSGNLQPITSQ